MKDRLQIFTNLCRKELEESKEKYAWGYGTKIIKPPPIENIKFTDPLIRSFMAECIEINGRLEKRRNSKCVEISEKLSDDKVNSNSDSQSDDNSDEKVEIEQEIPAKEEQAKNIEKQRSDSEIPEDIKRILNEDFKR